MKKKSQTILIIAFLAVSALNAQITPELKKAIESVPFARFDYPANRDRKKPPQVPSPQAFTFAYYNLPYAINLDMVKDESSNGYVGKVILDFNSIKLKSNEEKKLLKEALIQLQGLLEQQYSNAGLYGYSSYRHHRRGINQRIQAEGQIIIATREIISTENLMRTLKMRFNSI